MDISAIALGGLQQAQASLERVSRKIASGEDPVDTASLSTEVVALLSAKNQFAANIKVMQAANEMEMSSLALVSKGKPSS